MRLLAAASAIFLAFATPYAAWAAGGEEDAAFQKQVFGRALGTANGHACFRRIYDAPHLASHPQQNVRTMTLLVTGVADDPENPSYTLGLGVTFRKNGTHFETSGGCGSVRNAGAAGARPNAVHCGVDCDGGAIDVALKNARSVLVSIPEGARIWKAGSSDDEEPGDERRRFGADDKLFRLDRTALTDCIALTADADEKAALRRGQ